jgi:lipopolysaccharide export system protein LptA
MWRKRLRLAIALFVVLFAAVVALSLRSGRARKATPPAIVRIDPKATIENPRGGEYQRAEKGKITFSLKFGSQLTYDDGRTKLAGGVTVVLPDREGRTIKIESREANLLNPPNQELSHAEFSGGVTLTTSDGITVSAAQATYDDHEGMVRVPGPVTFSKGRMKGSGVGATYDRNREVLWLLDQAVIDGMPDEKGEGAIHITSAAAGMARMDHYLKFTRNARLEGEGRITEADEATLYLTQDDKKVQRMELRGNSIITATGQNTNGAQSMNADAIDLTYADDGRTLQTAKLVDKAVVRLPGQSTAAREVSGKTIDITMAPDGSTVTSLIAQENVQVDLPQDGDVPARRIRSASLAASGAPGAGLQNASFTGNVDYRESRPAKKDLAAIDRTARSLRLDVQTKPGFGDLERADFHGNVHFTDGTDTTADAPLAVYSVTQDRLDLTPSNDPGPSPQVANGRMTVDAAKIQMTLGTQSLVADTKVKSVLKSENRSQPPKAGARGARAGGPAPVAPLPPAKSSDSVRMPSLLKQSEPVNVTANRLEYDGANSRATYTGAARLWQTDTVVRGDTITLDQKSGNLHATTNVVTVMTLTQSSQKPKPGEKPAPKKAPSQPTTTTAEELVYDDAKHQATYTTKAHMNGPDGDVTGDKIELFLTEDGGELERAEADGSVVSRQEKRRAYGDHLTYLAAKDEYTMVGKPVKVFDDTPPDCKLTVGTTLTFHKAVDTISATGNGVSAGTKTETIACGTAGQPEWPR